MYEWSAAIDHLHTEAKALKVKEHLGMLCSQADCRHRARRPFRPPRHEKKPSTKISSLLSPHTLCVCLLGVWTGMPLAHRPFQPPADSPMQFARCSSSRHQQYRWTTISESKMGRSIRPPRIYIRKQPLLFTTEFHIHP